MGKYEQELTSACFQVPWGVIEAKCWGSESGKPFIGLHGWLDNANTFDKLAPLLPKDTYLVVIDFPGHGRSSLRPPGVPYTFLDWVIDVKRVITQLKWTRFSLIGHSMGAGVAALYSGVFPDEIEKLILLEYRGPSVAEEKDASSFLVAFTKNIISNQLKNNFKVFPDVKSVMHKILQANPELTEESARILTERKVHEVDGVVALRTEPRLRLARGRDVCGNYLVLTQSLVISVISHIKCPVLVVRGLKCNPLFRFQDEYMRERFNIMKKSASFYEYWEVDGNHCVHLNNAGIVAEKINNFLIRCDISKSKL
ncbi:serine hydrolase-like protein [Actinia tenebrosa]|uniref:Serine hydrolase-like protein n=1 Tax=Actinia tenebrosa TaxID=6105 RepID=A0A6P8J0D5_ACTTE|nr:serine hydrolase-like protein [Actinia tenebrosa]